MTLIKKDNNMNSNVNQLVKRFLSDDMVNWPNRQWEMARSPQVAVNISAREDSFHLDLAAPGFKKEDFKIEVDGEKLTISAENSDQKEDQNENFVRREFGYSSFKRSFVLPENTIDEEFIKASYENGVLSIDLPKKEEAKPRSPKKIEIS